MPGPYDFIKNQGKIVGDFLRENPTPAHLFGLAEPLVPEEAIKPLLDKIDSPSLERGPWEARLRGIGAGALEGLRQQTSPANLAALAANAIPGVGGGLRAARAAKGIPEALQGLQGASRVASEAPALGTLAAEYTPVGSEGIYNAGRNIANAVRDPAEAAYHAILKRGGR